MIIASHITTDDFKAALRYFSTSERMSITGTCETMKVLRFLVVTDSRVVRYILTDALMTEAVSSSKRSVNIIY